MTDQEVKTSKLRVVSYHKTLDTQNIEAVVDEYSAYYACNYHRYNGQISKYQ